MAQRVDVNCKTGQAAVVPLSPAEQADFDARLAAAGSATAAQTAAAAQRTADLAALRTKAATDPAFAALLRTLAIQ